jgi:hypothetical protein
MGSPGLAATDPRPQPHANCGRCTRLRDRSAEKYGNPHRLLTQAADSICDKAVWAQDLEGQRHSAVSGMPIAHESAASGQRHTGSQIGSAACLLGSAHRGVWGYATHPKICLTSLVRHN